MKLLRVLAILMLLGSTALAKPLVVVSIHPYFDLVRQIAGDLVDVVKLLPTGTSPHNFDPSPRSVQQVSQADLFIRNGGSGLDDWLLPLITASGSTAPMLTMMDHLEFDRIGTSAHAHEHEDEHGHDEEGPADEFYVNTHIWLDVTIMMSAAEAIRDELARLDPGNAASYEEATTVLLDDLASLDQELLETLAPVRNQPFVTLHDAWPYFAHRYGLDLVVELEPFAGREPSPAYLLQALELIQSSGARAIFAERQLSARPAEVVAEAAGLPLYLLDPEGGGATETESYQQLMRFNASVLLEALSD